MSDSILGDVKKLLDLEVGSKKILEQIKRAAENDEVISNFERNYVAKLLQEYLIFPEPELESQPQPSIEQTQKDTKIIKQTTTLVEETPSQTKSKSIFKNRKKIMIGGAVALAIIIAIAITSSNIQDNGPIIPPIIITGLTLDIDQTSYAEGDIISISGNSKTSFGNTISLSIENEDNELIWAEDISIKNSGSYSTLAIAGGPGWEKSGTYKLKVIHGSEDNEISFNFNN